ncbi:hypothetical protein EUTSA_v10023933mg, partial [Eutrema salsugineum]
ILVMNHWIEKITSCMQRMMQLIFPSLINDLESFLVFLFLEIKTLGNRLFSSIHCCINVTPHWFFVPFYHLKNFNQWTSQLQSKLNIIPKAILQKMLFYLSCSSFFRPLRLIPFT